MDNEHERLFVMCGFEIFITTTTVFIIFSVRTVDISIVSPYDMANLLTCEKNANICLLTATEIRAGMSDYKAQQIMGYNYFFLTYRKTSSISRTKSPNLNASNLVLQLSLLNPLKPGVKSRMKM